MTAQTGQGQVRPGAVLAVCSLSIVISSLDSSIVNVALHAISQDFGSGEEAMAWVVDGYTLALASFLVSSGVLADRIGRRRCFRIGLAVFALGSLLCSLAPSLPVLIAARALQGFGGSMLNPVALAIISSVYTDPARRSRALGVWGAALGAALALGPVLGGLLVDIAGWRSIFWINVPVCAIVIWATRFLPESFGDKGRRIGLLGQALAVAAMFLLVLAIIELPRSGQGAVLGWAAAAGFLCSATAAGLVLARSAQPFIDLRVFRSPSYAAANASGFAAAGGQALLAFTFAVLMQAKLGKSAVETGLSLLPLAAGIIAFSSASGRAMARWGARWTLFLGGFAILAGAVLLLAGGSSVWLPLVAMTVFGAGIGLSNNPIADMAVAGMGANAGAASAVMVTSRQLGISVGVALAGSVADPALGVVAPAWALLCGCGAMIVLSALLLRAPDAP